jgi:hemolysin activation/secretion protein
MQYGVITRVLGAAALFLFVRQAAAADPVSLRFDISAYRVEGNTLLKQEKIQSVLAPYKGKQRDFADVQRALEALEGAYRQAGYGAVQVYLPEQALEGGIVVLRVVEPRIGKVEVSGNKHFDSANIRRSVPSLHEGQPPSSRALADNLRAANESPVKQTRVVLRPSEQENQVDAKVEVEDDKPWRVFFTLDNTGTTDTGKTRLGVGLQHANVFNRDNVATVQYITSPEKQNQVEIYSLGYRIPLYRLGDSIDLFGGYSNVDAGTTQTPAGPLQFAGKGNVYGARYNLLFARQGEYEHKLVFGVDYRIYDNACSVGAFGAAGCGPAGASVSVHPVSVAYEGQSTGPSTQLSFYVSVAQNIPGGTDGTEADLALARPNAKGDYTILRYGANYGLAFKSDWQARVHFDSQYTEDALVQGEQFGVGGWNSVRGFLEREVAGDRGTYATMELYTPNIGTRFSKYVSNLRLLAFYDVGVTIRNHPVPGDNIRQSISSAGMGVRFGVQKSLAMRVDAASVIDQGGSQQRGSSMVHFGVLASF